MKLKRAVRSSSPEKKLAFERQRLLNLICSRLKRREVDIAEGFAEELFKKELEYALTKKTRLLRKYNNVLLKVIFAQLGVLFICTASMVLNIRPSFSLLVQAFSIAGIVSAFAVDGFLVKKFERTVRAIMDAYEMRKQYFVERVLSAGMRSEDPEEVWKVCGPTMID